MHGEKRKGREGNRHGQTGWLPVPMRARMAAPWGTAYGLPKVQVASMGQAEIAREILPLKDTRQHSYIRNWWGGSVSIRRRPSLQPGALPI